MQISMSAGTPLLLLVPETPNKGSKIWAGSYMRGTTKYQIFLNRHITQTIKYHVPDNLASAKGVPDTPESILLLGLLLEVGMKTC